MVHLPKTHYQILWHGPKVLFCWANSLFFFFFLIKFGHKFIDCPLQNDFLVSLKKKKKAEQFSELSLCLLRENLC